MERALALNPESAEANILEAKIYLKEGNEEAALSILLSVTESHPDSTNAYGELLRLYEKNEEYEYYKMHSIISSYSLIPIKNFYTVGLMEEHLFIDFVDQEWCWRAHYFNNMTCILVPDITITHELGISKKFLGKRISISSPFRIYFQTRNLLWLRKRDYVPLYWKRTNIKKLIYKIIYYSLFSNKRIIYIKNIFKGIFDGLTQK